MCGIFGLFDTNNQPVDVTIVERATNTLRHRGPDDEGYCLINTQTSDAQQCCGRDTVPELSYPFISDFPPDSFDLAFGHRRLAILDLSPAGHQPMCSTDETCWIVYNGEIYNYLELREELRALGYTFRTNTDTEVILVAYQAWGEDCLQRFNGMWAFALWDSRHRRLFCARDRFGIKPLFYYFDGRQFRFASEIKAILADPAISRVPNERIVFEYLAHNYVDHSPETFFRGVYQLPPAHYLVLDADELQNGASVELTPRRYWDLDPEYRIEGWTDAHYARRFYELLEDSIHLRLRSDVPIGTCLSGGLDSSSIVYIVNHLLRNDGMAATQIGERQNTFSSCFDDERFDERQYITEVLAVTGAERNYVFPDGQQLTQELPQLMWHHDEPFGSTSIYAQWNVFRRAAERGVTVVLDGQGGDELLAGYLRYYPYYHLDLLARGAWRDFWNEWQHYRIYHNHAPGSSLRSLFNLGTSVWLADPRERIRQLLGRSLDKLYSKLYWLSEDYARTYARFGKWNWQTCKFSQLFQEHLYRGLVGGLPALLRYEDRDSMAFSIEARVPFLDYRLVEYAFGLPGDQKIHDGLTKFVLREATRDMLPEKIRLRTDKMGFVTPETIWFQDHLASFAQEVIRSAPEQARVYFDPIGVDRLIDGAAENGAPYSTCNALWRVLSLCLWFDVFHVSGA